MRTVAAFLTATLTALASMAMAASPAPSAPAPDLSQVYDAGLSGDMQQALSLLKSIDRAKLNAKDSTAAACLERTFSNPPEAEDLPPRSRRILNAYRLYWQDAMLRRRSKEDAEKSLLDSLQLILGPASKGIATTLDDASDRVKLAIQADGLFALTGVTSPYYELMIWRLQTPTTYYVQLPKRSIDVHVVFLDKFVSLGWAGYTTCGRYHSGGWATQDSLYALRSAYDLESESFRVSYLAHEGTHFSDYKTHPKLAQPELEYRAKLVEIAMSRSTTYDLIGEFCRRNGLDRSVPHHFANYWVARGMSRKVFQSDSIVTDPARWRGASEDRLRRAARELLDDSDHTMAKLGAQTVERFLPDAAG